MLLKHCLSRHLGAITRRYLGSVVEEVDVAVVGGGMVGLAAAALIAQEPFLSKHRVLLLETGNEPPALSQLPPGPPFSNRVVAISPASVGTLDRIGVWSMLVNCAQSIRRMQVWDACSHAFITLERDAHNFESLAYVVETNRLSSALHSVAKESSNLQLCWNQRVEAIDFSGVGAEFKPVLLRLANNRCVSARLVVGADGANSAVRRAAGIHALQWHHDQRGIVATLQCDHEEHDEVAIAWQRFLPNGPIALLPLGAGYYSLVWSTTYAETTELLALPEDAFVERINHALWNDEFQDGLSAKIGGLLDSLLHQIVPSAAGPARQVQPTVRRLQNAPDTRAAFPLGFLHASQYVTPRVALLGDAAHRILPLAGQGVNLGFGDVQCLASILNAAAAQGADLGLLRHLRSYETERQAFVAPVLATIEAIHWLYGSSWSPAVVARSATMRLVHSAPPLKNFLVESACNGRLTFAA